MAKLYIWRKNELHHVKADKICHKVINLQSHNTKIKIFTARCSGLGSIRTPLRLNKVKVKVKTRIDMCIRLWYFEQEDPGTWCSYSRFLKVLNASNATEFMGKDEKCVVLSVVNGYCRTWKSSCHLLKFVLRGVQEWVWAKNASYRRVSSANFIHEEQIAIFLQMKTCF